MQLDVLLFASLRDAVDTPVISLDLPEPITAASLLKKIEEKYPPLRGQLDHVRVAVDQEFQRGEEVIPPGAEVALIPPVSGG